MSIIIFSGRLILTSNSTNHGRLELRLRSRSSYLKETDPAAGLKSNGFSPPRVKTELKGWASEAELHLG
jgi:hypothetical protein